MKRIFLIFITILWVLMLSTVTSGASASHTVDKVDIVADLRSDGSVLVTEEWTVTVPEACDECFIRDIVIVDDNFERITAVTDMSVSLDGNTCTEGMGESLEYGEYFYEKTDGTYSVMWYIPEAGTHTFSIRYIQTGAVKLYNGKAYFYFRAVNDDSSMICRNMTVTVNAPAVCYGEDFEILEAGTLAGEKKDGSIIFTAANTAGLVKIGVAMPDELFNSSGITVIVDDSRGQVAVTVILIIVLVAVSAYGVYFAFNYKKIILKSRMKKAKNKVIPEKFDRLQRYVFRAVGPAKLLNTVLDGITDKSDYFTVTLLDLVNRGYIKASADGFTAKEVSETDSIKRPLDENEKRIIRLFSSGRWSELITSPKVLYNEVEAFNKKIGMVMPFVEFSPKGKKLVSYCFELRLTAKRFEFITPEEISDVFFRTDRYNICDLVVSLINEYDSSCNEAFEKPSTDNFKYNMFMFRDVYLQGEKLELELIEARKQAKQRKKNGED